MPAILAPTRRQVNAEGLVREVHAAEEGALESCYKGYRVSDGDIANE